MISDEIGLAIMNDCDFNDYVFASPHNVTESCDLAINEANGIVGDYINNYDVILDVCYPSLVEQELRLRKLVLIYLLSFSLFFVPFSCCCIVSLSNSPIATFSAGY